MSYKYKILLTVTPLVLILDQLTKWLILQSLAIGDLVPVISGFFDIVHVRNSGAAFGMFASMPDDWRVPFFYLISAVAILALVYFFVTLPVGDRWHPWPLGLISAGVLGNLADRVRFGNVVDFLSFHIGNLYWPAFNIADSAITISMFLLLWPMLKKR